ncbi:Mitochondrial metal transporter 2 [Durusdinium trenchii]|uniref:Mitochondrial metal transporter 2 n=1 Tax=Durusdinium trenchii TaxID=1381693 RepID=A0ABP0KW12_9DINO
MSRPDSEVSRRTFAGRCCTGFGWAASCSAVLLFSIVILQVNDLIQLFWLGTLVNVALSVTKIILAQVTVQKALMADAIHGLGDTAAEVVTAFAYIEAARPPDKEHPWGHGKIESIGAVIVTCILLYISFSMGYDSITSLRPMLAAFQQGRSCNDSATGKETQKEVLTANREEESLALRRAVDLICVRNWFCEDWTAHRANMRQVQFDGRMLALQTFNASSSNPLDLLKDGEPAFLETSRAAILAGIEALRESMQMPLERESEWVLADLEGDDFAAKLQWQISQTTGMCRFRQQLLVGHQCVERRRSWQSLGEPKELQLTLLRPVTGYTSELLNAVSSCSPSSVEDVLTRGQEPRFSSMEVMCSGSFFTRHSWGKEVRHS